MTDTVPAADIGLSNIIPFPKGDTRVFLPLDPKLFAMLCEEPWREVGMSCRLALAWFRVGGDDLVQTLGSLIDEDPAALAETIRNREAHRKVLQRCLALLRAADRRENAAFDQALAARGF